MCKIKSFIYPSYLVVTLLQDLFLTQAGVRTLPSWHLCDWQTEIGPKHHSDKLMKNSTLQCFSSNREPVFGALLKLSTAGGSQLCGIPQAFDQKPRVTTSFQHRVQANPRANANRSSSFNINNSSTGSWLPRFSFKEDKTSVRCQPKDL